VSHVCLCRVNDYVTAVETACHFSPMKVTRNFNCVVNWFCVWRVDIFSLSIWSLSIWRKLFLVISTVHCTRINYTHKTRSESSRQSVLAKILPFQN